MAAARWVDTKSHRQQSRRQGGQRFFVRRRALLERPMPLRWTRGAALAVLLSSLPVRATPEPTEAPPTPPTGAPEAPPAEAPPTVESPAVERLDPKLDLELEAKVAPGTTASWPSEWTGRPVERLEIVTAGGEWQVHEPFSAERLGAPFSAELARELTRELLNTGHYASATVEVHATPGGVALRMTAIPRRLVGSLRVSLSTALPELALEAAGVRAGDEIVPADLDRIADRLEQAFRGRGYYAAAAWARALETKPGREVQVVLEVSAGAQARVARRQLLFLGGADPTVRRLAREYGVQSRAAADELRLTAADAELQTQLRREGYPEAQVGHRLAERQR
jgi:hypothetical protein